MLLASVPKDHWYLLNLPDCIRIISTDLEQGAKPVDQNNNQLRYCIYNARVPKPTHF